VPRARTSISLDLAALAVRTVDVELESGAETKFLTRFYVMQGEDGITGGVGLGLRRFLVGTLWGDIGGEYVVAPDSQKTASDASAIRVVNAFQVTVDLLAQEAIGERMLPIPLNSHGPAVLHGYHHAARIGAIMRANGPDDVGSAHHLPVLHRFI
jgi:hypothetical protein